MMKLQRRYLGRTLSFTKLVSPTVTRELTYGQLAKNKTLKSEVDNILKNNLRIAFNQIGLSNPTRRVEKAMKFGTEVYFICMGQPELVGARVMRAQPAGDQEAKEAMNKVVESVAEGTTHAVTTIAGRH